MFLFFIVLLPSCLLSSIVLDQYHSLHNGMILYSQALFFKLFLEYSSIMNS